MHFAHLLAEFHCDLLQVGRLASHEACVHGPALDHKHGIEALIEEFGQVG